ncbi:MAG: relaxase, partial [Pseudomonadaceae bacterium]|nr:relaxase [Pseudomonadaceae bacterium]
SSGIFGKSPETNTGGDIENTRCSEPSESQSMVKNSSSSGSGSNSNSSPGGGWNARFKAASAKARDKRSSVDAAVGASNTGGTKFNARDLQATKQIDPLPFIERMGYSIKKDGRHFSIRHGKDEAYRLTCKPDGHWVWVDKYGSHGGDNIDLVRELSGLDRFIDCVYELNGGLRATPVPMPIPVAPKPPRIPPESSTGRMAGRMYLNDRGISDSTINHAEQSGFLRYLADGLLFVGYQAGKIWNATKRSIMPDAEIPKRDLAGSDKSKSQILEGNLESIWIVEGGIDALAVHDIAKRQGKTPPTVIVSGGSCVKSFLENSEIMEKIRAARLVVVAGENEKNAEVQAKTDAQHEAQLELVKALNPSAQAMLWKPKSIMGSDVADYNLNVQNQKQEQKEIDATQKVKPNNFNM